MLIIADDGLLLVILTFSLATKDTGGVGPSDVSDLVWSVQETWRKDLTRSDMSKWQSRRGLAVLTIFHLKSYFTLADQDLNPDSQITAKDTT